VACRLSGGLIRRNWTAEVKSPTSFWHEQPFIVPHLETSSRLLCVKGCLGGRTAGARGCWGTFSG
jgi:hypothetical protein